MPSKLSLLELRLLAVLRRHIREEEDTILSDRDFILKMFDRYHKYLKEELVDVGE